MLSLRRPVLGFDVEAVTRGCDIFIHRFLCVKFLDRLPHVKHRHPYLYAGDIFIIHTNPRGVAKKVVEMFELFENFFDGAWLEFTHCLSLSLRCLLSLSRFFCFWHSSQTVREVFRRQSIMISS